MFEDPNEGSEEEPAERALHPATAAKDKADQFRMHAELAAVFEGHRKFDAELRPGLDAEMARSLQRTMGKLAKVRIAETALSPPEASDDAAGLLNLPLTRDL